MAGRRSAAATPSTSAPCRWAPQAPRQLSSGQCGRAAGDNLRHQYGDHPRRWQQRAQISIPASNTFTEYTPISTAPDIVPSKTTPQQSSVAPGGNITYSVTVNNMGSGQAQGVVVTETVPANTVFVGPSGPAGWTSIGSGRYTWSPGHDQQWQRRFVAVHRPGQQHDPGRL